VIDQGRVLALGTPEALKHDYGHQVLRITPKEAGDRNDILTRYPDRLAGEAGETLMLTSDDAFVEEVLARYGTGIRSLTVDVPSLETVFLSLTGRDLRDRAAGARERTLSFGKRGGEHTR